MVFFICDCVLRRIQLGQNSFPCKRMQHFSIESERKKDFILNALDEASLRVLDFTYWIYAVSLSSPLTNFITFQTMFLCHKTEYPDELSFQKKQNIPTGKCYM